MLTCCCKVCKLINFVLCFITGLNLFCFFYVFERSLHVKIGCFSLNTLEKKRERNIQTDQDGDDSQTKLYYPTNKSGMQDESSARNTITKFGLSFAPKSWRAHFS